MSAAATAAAGGGPDWQTIAIILGTALSASVVVAGFRRARIDKKRSDWRSEDRLEGWIDRAGRWHPGVIDYTFGWDDASGRFHPGVPTELRELRRDFNDHISDGHGAPIPP